MRWGPRGYTSQFAKSTEFELLMVTRLCRHALLDIRKLGSRWPDSRPMLLCAQPIELLYVPQIAFKHLPRNLVVSLGLKVYDLESIAQL